MPRKQPTIFDVEQLALLQKHNASVNETIQEELSLQYNFIYVIIWMKSLIIQYYIDIIL